MPKAATGLSEAREAAGAIAKSRIACFLVAERIRSKQKATQNIKKLKTQNLASKVKKIIYTIQRMQVLDFRSHQKVTERLCGLEPGNRFSS